MNKLIPLMLGLTMLSGSMAMAAPTTPSKSPVSKSHHRVVAKKHIVKKATSKKAGKTVISKK